MKALNKQSNTKKKKNRTKCLSPRIKEKKRMKALRMREGKNIK
jgi:hypothetical protein